VIGPSGAVRVLVATKPVDFRKGAEGLAALVREQMQADPFSGAVYVFRAKRADRVKLIYWDGTGVCLFAKRLEDGRFRWPSVQDGVMRLGAALTYARRYALFTLVGIAGEDDVDAPDLVTPQPQSPEPERPKGNGTLYGGKLHAPYPAPGRSSANVRLVGREPVLDPNASAELRDRLLGELNEFKTGDDAALWAHRSLRQKNRLTTADAQCLEQAFQARIMSFASPAEPHTSAQTEHQANPDRSKAAQPKKKQSQPKGIDKSTLRVAEPRRVRDREHVRYVAKQECLICGRTPSDPHHLRFAQTRALGRKVSDEFTVPLCRGHHREVHRCGDEAAWWRKVAVDPTVAARALWLETRPPSTGPHHLTSVMRE
jgi:hypothetical protein